MNIYILIISILITTFIFLILFNFRRMGINSYMEKLENYAGHIFNKGLRISHSEEIKSFLQIQKSVRILGIRIKSLEGLTIQRLFFSTSSFIVINLYGLLFNRNLLVLSVITSLILYFFPLVIIKNKISDMKKEIAYEIPDIVDILSSLIKAGLNPDQALDYICDNFKGETTRLIMLAKIKIFEGYSKKDAFYEVAKKSLSNEFKTVVKVLVQSDKIGHPVSRALKDISLSMRNNQRDSIKIQAERMESNLIIVVFLFMFIPMMILFMLPVLPQIKVLFS